MNNLKHNIKHIMHQELDYQNIPSNFEGLWEEYTMKSNKPRHKKLSKAIIIAAVITSMSVSVIGATQLLRRSDNINIAYETDTDLIGTWEVVDFVEKIKDFKVDKQNWPLDDLHSVMYQLRFKEGGTVGLSKKEAGLIASPPCGFTWTRSFIIHKNDVTTSQYTIKKIDNEEYMFMQWKSGDYIFYRLDEPYYYVFKKVSDDPSLPRTTH